MKPRATSLLKRSTIGGAKEEARRYREEVDAEFKSERRELKQIESRLTERARALTAKTTI